MVSDDIVRKVATSENKPGHRKFETYNLPDWVRHPLKPQPLKAAALFPGEQNHYIGMLKDVRKKPVVKDMFAQAEDVFGVDFESLMKDGPASKMKPTAVNQPLIYLADCAAYELFKEKAPEVAGNLQGVAGFGVGEYAALYAAGVITFGQGLELVKVRADAMQELADEVEMEALQLRSASHEKLERQINTAIKQDSGANTEAAVYVAQYWCPEGYVCAGRRSTVLKLMEIAEKDAKGVVEVRLLPDHLPAAHTPLAAEAGAKVAAMVDQLLPELAPPWCELYLNSTGFRVPAGSSPYGFAEALKNQLTEPLQWEGCVTQMLNFGIRQFYECGPSRSLKYMLGFYEHCIEAPLHIIRPSELTINVTV